jgi:hypothetical protein
MANALTLSASAQQGQSLAQLLHGYSEGHRLLESSFKPQDDLTRLMLRMSDLSGHSMVAGFEDYITGYPLSSINAYALAKTWYAPEMPRPGCVWTHTFVIPAQTLATIRSLHTVIALFKRPLQDSYQGQYSKNLVLREFPAADATNSIPTIDLRQLLWCYYGKGGKPLILSAKDSIEFESMIFALWSQQWPTLRMAFTFCTGSLSTRTFAGRPFDIQCVPTSLTREVFLETTSGSSTEPILLPSPPDDYPEWISSIVADTDSSEDSRVRNFLWEASDEFTTRSDFIPLATVFHALDTTPELAAFVALVADVFPQQAAGGTLKRLLLGKQATQRWLANHEEQDILFALATTSNYQSFDGEALSIRERGANLCIAKREAATWLVGELFRASLNPLGEEILAGLISAMEPETARQVTSQQLQFLPALFRAKPALAGSSQLWLAGADRKRELFEAVASHENLSPEVVANVVNALLDSGSEAFIRRALDLWGKNAVFQALDWTDAHAGSMSETVRAALTAHLPSVMAWVERRHTRSFESLIAVAHVVAPYTQKTAKHDSSIWLSTFRFLQNSDNEREKSYFATFLLALAFCNAPPAPLDLVSEAFERVHETARRDQLSDTAWIIVEPFVPELSWLSNWDKCERLRRGLVAAFVRYNWPALELKQRIRDYDLLRQIFKSARRVDGGEYYFRGLYLG